VREPDIKLLSEIGSDANSLHYIVKLARTMPSGTIIGQDGVCLDILDTIVAEVVPSLARFSL
jgi:hypothetical protein